MFQLYNVYEKPNFSNKCFPNVDGVLQIQFVFVTLTLPGASVGREPHGVILT